MDEIVIPLPWQKPPLTGNRTRGNPYARANEVAKAKEEARWAVRAVRPRAIVGASITLHFRPKTRQRRDADGMFPTLKVVQDALVLEGVLPDDSWIEVPRSSCAVHPPSSGGPAMWVELENVVEFAKGDTHEKG